MLVLTQWKHTQHSPLLLTAWALNTFSFAFAPGSHLENLCILKDNLLVSTWTTWTGRTKLLESSFLLTAKVSQVKSRFHFPQSDSSFNSSNKLASRKKGLFKGLCQLHSDY